MDTKYWAIWLTEIGLKYGTDYYHKDLVFVYQNQGVDGTDYVVNVDNNLSKFSSAYDAAEMFSELVWKNEGI